ncbi:hypothetical protein ACFV23_20755 [Streptomyces sp. NPDC059627]
MAELEEIRQSLMSGADTVSRGVFGSKGSAGDGGSAVADVVLGDKKEALTETYDVTARFFLEGNRYKVEVKTLERRAGAKEHTDTDDFGLTLNKSPASVQFSAHTMDAGVHHMVDGKSHYIAHKIKFSLSAMASQPGSDVPQRLYEKSTKDGVKIVTDLRRVQ